MTQLNAMSSPFGALSRDFSFLPDTAVEQMVRLHARGNMRDWRVEHLPLVAGRASHSFLDEVHAIGGGNIRTVKADVLPEFVPDIHFQAGRYASVLCDQLKDQNISYLPQLADVGARAIGAIVAQDQHWYGHDKDSHYCVMLEHGRISKFQGRHMGVPGVPHRDNKTSFADAPHRSWAFRSYNPPDCWSNRLTENIENWNLADMVRGQPSLSLEDGSLVLMNTGRRGTAHRSRHPLTIQGERPSLHIHVYAGPIYHNS